MTGPHTNMILLGWAMVAFLMTVLWFVGRRTRNAGWVDLGWALGTGGLGVLYAGLGDGVALHRIAAGLFGGIWGLRLSLLLWFRLHDSSEEEPRYARLRARWSRHTELKMFLMFQAQALLAVLLSVPFYFAATRSEAASPLLLLLGAVFWLLGLAGESIADHQLTQFKKRPENRGQVCDVGLWRLSRHPNYFFEWILWFGHAFIGTGLGTASLSWLSPVLIGVLVVWVTGIPPSERQSLASRGDAYRRYMARTSPFLPWPPRSSVDPAEETGREGNDARLIQSTSGVRGKAGRRDTVPPEDRIQEPRSQREKAGRR